jgi:hypothetical protein
VDNFSIYGQISGEYGVKLTLKTIYGQISGLTMDLFLVLYTEYLTSMISNADFEGMGN